jgi:hypothetical protein
MLGWSVNSFSLAMKIFFAGDFLETAPARVAFPLHAQRAAKLALEPIRGPCRIFAPP